MKLTITHLKAPWPTGAVVGDVIELASVPAWAVGKCAPADDGAAVTFGFMLTEDGEDTATGDGTGKALPVIIDELRSQAAALGLKVDGRWSRERLIAEIEKAQG